MGNCEWENNIDRMNCFVSLSPTKAFNSSFQVKKRLFKEVNSFLLL